MLEHPALLPPVQIQPQALPDFQWKETAVLLRAGGLGSAGFRRWGSWDTDCHSLPGAAITNTHRRGGLKQYKVISHGSGGQKPKSRSQSRSHGVSRASRSRGSREEPLLASSSFRWLHVTQLVEPLPQLHAAFSSVCHIACLTLIRTCIIGFRAHLHNSG